MPTGVVTAKSAERAGASSEREVLFIGGGRLAIRMPRESPSNSWWKNIAVTSDAVSINIHIKHTLTSDRLFELQVAR